MISSFIPQWGVFAYKMEWSIMSSMFGRYTVLLCVLACMQGGWHLGILYGCRLIDFHICGIGNDVGGIKAIR